MAKNGPHRGGAPKGNRNAANFHEFKAALRRVLVMEGGDYRAGLDKVAAKLLVEALKGEGWAIKEIADRIDGKAKQQVEVSGDEEAPLVARIERVIVSATQATQHHGDQDD